MCLTAFCLKDLFSGNRAYGVSSQLPYPYPKKAVQLNSARELSSDVKSTKPNYLMGHQP